jgi:hypothetical protein
LRAHPNSPLTFMKSMKSLCSQTGFSTLTPEKTTVKD